MSQENGNQLREPQVRVLKALAKAKSPMNRNDLAEAASCRVHMLSAYLGSNDEEKRKVNDERHYMSLLSLDLVKMQIVEGKSGRDAVHYTITAKGKKVAEKMAK